MTESTLEDTTSAGEWYDDNGILISWPGGGLAWHEDGEYHRVMGPALILSGGEYLEWWIEGRRYKDNNSFQRAGKLTDEDMCAIILKYSNVT